ncbi:MULTISPECIES: hypothetical protein [unclassified Bordetella]|uniref:hypothetical protein n=1 Tax=unclassified Bordetella TaxID=2630031 RepID=UPI001325B9B4|nr:MULTISPECIES: hypothetical protein [unclassified Bordetella]MVW72578.1 hypothetical protein [Bordetella sp. 15P40C-2]MVW78510.1 hypothetical protein [Bordetella sp. 02P26C-1]
MHTLAKQDLMTVSGGYCWADEDDDDFRLFEFGSMPDPFALIDQYIEPPWLQYTLKAGLIAIYLGIAVTFIMNATANDDDC